MKNHSLENALPRAVYQGTTLVVPQKLTGSKLRTLRLTAEEAKLLIYSTGLEHGMIWTLMGTSRKITVEVPPELLEKAQRATGTGITQTVRTGLELVAASRAYARLRQLRGKIRCARTWTELKVDR